MPLDTPRALPSGAAAALVLALLGGCGDGGSTVAAPPASVPVGPSTSASASPSASPSSDVDQLLVLTYARGVVEGDSGRVRVALGSRVRIVVTSDVAEELHLHVYDVTRQLAPGKPSEIVFTADVPGQVELELEGTRTTLARLVIS